MSFGGGGRYRRMMGDTGKAKAPLSSLRRVLPWLAPYWPVMLFGLACMIGNTLLTQQPPRVAQYIVDHVIAERREDDLRGAILIAAAIYLCIQLSGFLRTFSLHVAGQRLLHDLRRRLYEHFQRLSLTYYDNKQTGDLMSRMTSDVEQIEHIMVHGLDIFLMGFFSMALAFFYMFNYNHALALLILIPVPVLVVSIYFFGKKIRVIYRSIRDRIGDLNAKLQENIAGIRVIKAFGREPSEFAKVETNSEHVMTMNIRGIRMWSGFGPLMGLVGNIGAVLVLGYGAHLALQGQLKVGELTAFIWYVGFFYQPIGQFFQFFDSIQRSLAAAERILEVLDTTPDIEDPASPQPLENVRGEVEFRDVAFKYSTGEMVLRDINLKIEPGRRIALVGRSGAGKTSFVNLIPRFYDALEGEILVEGVDVRNVRQADLRRHIAMVLQETYLFNGTVRDNLRYGKLNATDDELIEAATIANAHEFVEHLPAGYDTEIGERGVRLSGGQKQRIAIARAVLANPRILILDEATSSVDSESEFLIHQALDRLMEGRTTFIIAHRLSTIRNADKILVLEDGAIVEQGPHEELLDTDGLYADMYRRQFQLDDYLTDAEMNLALPEE